MAKAILIKQLKGNSQRSSIQKKILKGLGLRGNQSSIYRSDTRAIRGMINRVQHLVAASQVDRSTTKRPATKTGASRGFKFS